MGFPTWCDSSHCLGTLTMAKTGQMVSCTDPKHGSRNQGELLNLHA